MGPYLSIGATHRVAVTLLQAAGVRLPGADQLQNASC